MKKFFIPALAVFTLFISCAKDPQVINDQELTEDSGRVVEFKATINNDEVKTDYSISGSTAIFHWTGTETIGRLWFSGSSFGHDAFTSTTSADASETSLIFSGSESVDQTDYAMYPIWNGTTKTGIGWSSNPFNLYLHESMVYDTDHPLKNVVPMIAKLNAGEFEFVPVCGIIAVTVKNLPPTATKITLSSTMALSGNYRLTSTPADYATYIDGVMTTGLTTGLAWDAGNYSSTKSFTFSGLDRDEHVFYFPVSVATNEKYSTYDDRYSGMTITVYAGDDVLQTVTTTNKIAVDRGEIVRFPMMDLAKATKVAVTGCSDQFYAYLTTLGPDVASVKFAVAASADEAITAAESSSKIVSASGVENKVEVSDDLSSTGLYYLGYKVYDSSSTELISGSIPVYYISSTDVAQFTGTYTWSTLSAFSRNATSSWIDLTGKTDSELVIEKSNDPTKGCIMITSLDGFSYTGTMTNTSIIPAGTALNPGNTPINFEGTYGAGNPQYGYFENYPTLLRFVNTSPFFSLNGTNYYLRHGSAQYSYINFEVAATISNVRLTYGSGSGFCFADESKIKNTGTYDSSEVCLRFNGNAVAQKAL